MNSNDEFMLLSDLPESLIKCSSDILHSYSTGLIKIPNRQDSENDAILLGSGTFVSVEGIYGILTAHHVTENIDRGSILGLIVKPEEHRNVIQSQYVEVINIDRGEIDSQGPDLSFVVLPSVKVSEIKPYKQFFDLTFHREKMLSNPPDPHSGIWFVCGIPDIDTRVEKSEKGYDKMKSYFGFCGAGGANRIYNVGEYDYVEMDIEYKDGAKIPMNFGGASGGGLWFVPIRFGLEKDPEAIDHILAGIVFYQTELKNSKRILRSHGLVSLYEKAYNVIVEKCS